MDGDAFDDESDGADDMDDFILPDDVEFLSFVLLLHSLTLCK